MKQIKPQVWLSANQNFPNSASIITVEVEQQRPNKKSCSPSAAVRDWLLSLSDGRKRVRSLKLQLFWTLAGLLPSTPTSVAGERRSFTDICLLFMLWPRGLAMRTRSRKLKLLTAWEERRGTEEDGKWGRGQINMEIIKHGMEIKMYLTKVWFNKNCCDGLFWTCISLLNSSSKTVFCCHDLEPRLTWKFFPQSLKNYPKLFSQIASKDHHATQTSFHGFPQSASNILKNDSLTTLLLLIPSMWSSPTTFLCTFLSLM